MSKRIDLQKAHILIVDHDRLMSDVLKETLTRMGLVNLSVARHGRAALDVIRQQPVDILITEWDMQPMDGMTLINTLRQSEEARYALLPAIMLTGRAEKPDVIEARDKGVTEFLVKPFTAKTLYNRLEHIIDFPRDFLVTEQYVGPDRRRVRRSLQQIKLTEDRRVTVPIAQPETSKMPIPAGKQPRRIIPSHALKRKIGLMDSLDKVITEETLQSAQEAINSFSDASLIWIAEDIKSLDVALDAVLAGNYQEALDQAKSALLSLKSRAGTFDYLLASEVAFAFYGFLRNHFSPNHPSHLTILRKHREVLKIILSRQVKGNGTGMERELAEGLKLMTVKLQEA